MDHVEHAINGTIELAADFAEKLKQNQRIELRVAKMAIQSRLTQILSLMTMSNAPSPWVNKKGVIRELLEGFESAHQDRKIEELIHRVQTSL